MKNIEYKNYSRLFQKVKNSKELDAEEKLLLTEMISVTIQGTPYQYTNAQMAEWLGMAESTVKKRIKSLREKGIIISVTKNVPPEGKKKRYFKQRTITIVKIEDWIEIKGGSSTIKQTNDYVIRSDSRDKQVELQIPTNIKSIHQSNDTSRDFSFNQLTENERQIVKSKLVEWMESDNKKITEESIQYHIGLLSEAMVKNFLKH